MQDTRDAFTAGGIVLVVRSEALIINLDSFIQVRTNERGGRLYVT